MFRDSKAELSDQESEEEIEKDETNSEKVIKNKWNVWSEVIHDQILSSELGSHCGVGREMVKRCVESYDLPEGKSIQSRGVKGGNGGDGDNGGSKMKGNGSYDDIFNANGDDGEVFNGDRKVEGGGKEKGVKERLGVKKDGRFRREGGVKVRLGMKKDLRKKLMRSKGRVDVMNEDEMEKVFKQHETSDQEYNDNNIIITSLLTILKEPDHMKSTFDKILEVLGIEGSEKLLRETQDVQLRGGMLTLDGSRYRSIGGVFLNLLKRHTTTQQCKHIFRDTNNNNNNKNTWHNTNNVNKNKIYIKNNNGNINNIMNNNNGNNNINNGEEMSCEASVIFNNLVNNDDDDDDIKNDDKISDVEDGELMSEEG